MDKIRLLIAESREIIQNGIVEVLKDRDDIKVVSICSNYEDIILNANKIKPDIILVGTVVEGGEKVQLIKILKEQNPGIKIAMIIPPIYDYYFEPSTILESEADAIVSGDLDVDTLFNEITEIYNGHDVKAEKFGNEFYKKARYGRIPGYNNRHPELSK
jgi:DNA-binding NarL/FixJ family response regulator